MKTFLVSASLIACVAFLAFVDPISLLAPEKLLVEDAHHWTSANRVIAFAVIVIIVASLSRVLRPSYVNVGNGARLFKLICDGLIGGASVILISVYIHLHSNFNEKEGVFLLSDAWPGARAEMALTGGFVAVGVGFVIGLLSCLEKRDSR